MGNNLNEDFRDLNTEKNAVFTFDRPTVCIDILTKVKGLIFDETFRNAKNIILSEINVRMIDIRDLINAKKSANRPKDQDDLEHLTNL